MSSLPPSGRISALLVMAILPALFGEVPPSVKKLWAASSPQFNTTAQELLHGMAENPPSLSEAADFCCLLKGRGEASRETKKLAEATLLGILTASDLEKRYGLRDGIALWQSVQFNNSRDYREPAADAIRRLAAALDDAALTNAFLKVSPPAQSAAGNATQFKEEELNQIQRPVLFWLVSDRWIERELEKIRKSPRPEFLCPPFKGAVPESVRKEFSAEAISTWIEGARCSAWLPQAASVVSASRRERSGLGQPNLEGLIDRFFRAPGSVRLEEISRLYWTSGGWCGTGGEAFREIQQRMILMLHLRDRQLPQALGAALSEERLADFLPSPSWRSRQNWRLQLLEICGLDWEKLLSSKFLPYRSQSTAKIPCKFATSIITGCGSTFGGRIFLEMQKRALSEGHMDVYHVAQFITPGNIPAGSRPEIAREVQDELVQLSVAKLRGANDPNSLLNSIEALARLQRPEIKEAIRSLLDSQFDSVAQSASRAMAIMGEDIPPRRPSDAKFLIYLNGVPWTASQESYTIFRFETKDKGWDPDHFIESRYDVLKGVTFDHDQLFQRQAQISQGQVIVRPKPAFIDFLSTASLAQPWFVAPVELPISFDRLNEVRATTQSFVIRVTYPRPLSEYAEQKVELRLRRLDEMNGKESREPDVQDSRFLVSVREEYQFAALQAGRYQLSIIAPGAARTGELSVDVKPGMEPFTIRLDPASAIKAQIKLPEFKTSDELPMMAIQALQPESWHGDVPIAKLFQNGKEVATAKGAYDSQSGIVSFANVPPGKYQLRVLGAKDFAELRPEGLTSEDGKPATAVWDKAEIDVEVRPDSPATLNVGEIALKRVTLPVSRQ